MDQIYRISAPDKEIAYPSEIVQQLQQTKQKRIVLRGPKPHLKARSAGAPELKDFCRIMSFSYNAPENRGSVDAVLSIVNPANIIKMTGVLLDLSDETRIGELPPVQGSGAYCELSGPFTLDRPPKNPESLAVLVNAD